MSLVVRPARPDDAAAMAVVSRESFAEPLRDVLITTQPGIGAYWDAMLRMPSSFPGRRYLVAELADRVVGMAEFRESDSSDHLSHICVDGSARGRGVATHLIQYFVDTRTTRNSLELNVFADNVAALGLYESLGFTRAATTDWFMEPLPDRSQGFLRGLHVENALDQAAWFGAFGFCEVRGTRADGRPFHVGRVGDRFIRLFDPHDVTDEQFLLALRRLFPSATTALLLAEPGVLGGGLLLFASSVRMVATELGEPR